MTLTTTLKLSSLRSLLFFALLLSTLIAINTADWFLMWAALEINMISFIPLLFFSRLSPTWNSATEYFFPQAGGSLLILAAAILALQKPLEQQLGAALILVAMMVKGGLAPFHYWFINLFASLNSWLLCFILATWQKLIPIFTLSFILLPASPFICLPLALLGAFWGMLLAANQTNIQSFIAYSSVGNLGWFLFLTPSSSSLALSFFFIYALMLAALMMLFSSHAPSSALSLSSSSLYSLPLKAALSLSLLSLAGFPPTTGFVMKVWVISSASALSPLVLWLLFLPMALGVAAYMRFIFYLLFNSPKKTSPPHAFGGTTLFLPAVLVIAIHCSPLTLLLLQQTL